MFVPPSKATTVLALPAEGKAVTVPVDSPTPKTDPVISEGVEVKSPIPILPPLKNSPDTDPVISEGVEVKSSVPVLPPLEGSPSKDALLGTEDNDIIYGYEENDFILAGAGDDLAFGGPGNDGILGGLGSDFLFGDSGHDWLEGGPGDDHLFGGLGNDVLYGGPGIDILTGGAGGDTFVIGTQTEDDLINHPTYGTVAPGLTVITDFQASEGDLLNVSPLLDRPAFADLADPGDLAAFITLQPVGADTQMIITPPLGIGAVEALLLGVAPTDIPASALVFTPPLPPMA